MRARSLSGLLAIGWLCAFCPTCAGPTEVELEVYNEVDCAKRPIVGISGGSDPAQLGEGALLGTSSACDSATRRSGSMIIQPSGDRDDSFFVQVVTRNDDQPIESCTTANHYTGCIVARRKVRFTPHSKLSVRVDLRLACLDIRCDDPSTTCAAGKCVPAFVPDSCPPPCDETALSATGSGVVPDSGTSDTSSLADQSVPEVVTPSDGPTGDAALALPTADMIVAGDNHTCLLDTSGTLRCWGRNESGQIGTGNLASPVTTMFTVGLDAPVHAVAAGANHTCAVLTTGALRCWGDNSAGQIGGPSVPTAAFPISGPAITSGVPVGIFAGGNHTCAFLDRKAIQCWGENTNGELGNGTTQPSSVLTDVPLGAWVPNGTMSLGTRHTCAIGDDSTAEVGTVRCWGANDQGQLGDGLAETHSAVPVKVAGARNQIAVAAGGLHTCVMSDAQAFACWGYNANKQVGSSNATELTPYTINLAGNPFGIYAGGEHTCALILEASYALACWGLDASGQASGTSGAAKNPGDVEIATGPSAIRSAALGAKHSCALSTDGTVRCWGNNFFGQLGRGDVNVHDNDIQLAR